MDLITWMGPPVHPQAQLQALAQASVSRFDGTTKQLVVIPKASFSDLSSRNTRQRTVQQSEIEHSPQIIVTPPVSPVTPSSFDRIVENVGATTTVNLGMFKKNVHIVMPFFTMMKRPLMKSIISAVEMQQLSSVVYDI